MRRSVITAVWILAGLLPGTHAFAQAAREGYVLRVEGQLAFIDLGAQHEVIPDDVFEMVRQETIIHPVTGENLGGEVPVGAVRVVEIFPRVSTAVVVRLEPGVNLRQLDIEARQGLIRVRSASPEMADEVKVRAMRAGGRPMVYVPPRPMGRGNPDGPLKGLVPEIAYSTGTRLETDLPDRAYKLVADPALLALADTSGAIPLENINGTTDYALSLLVPMSTQWTLTTQIGLGSSSMMAVGARIYPGSFKGKGAAVMPEGRIYEPVISLSLGQGGAGASSVPPEIEAQLVPRAGLPVPASFFPDSTLAFRDSLYQATLTDSLRAAAGDSLSALARHGLGLSLGVSMPVTDKLVGRLGLIQFGNIRQFYGGVIWFFGRDGGGDVNPDGVLRSFIVKADGIWDSEASKALLDLRITVPLTAKYTASIGTLTDFGGRFRVGLALKGYFRGR